MGECFTNIDQYRTEYKWTIKQFDSLIDLYEISEQSGINLKSPYFYAEMENEMIEWFLEIKFNSTSNEYKDWISLAITYRSEKKSTIHSHYKIYILQSKEKKTEICKTEKLVTFCHGTPHDILEFYKKDEIIENAKDLLPNNSLTIICELLMLGEPITKSGPCPISIPKCEIFADYQELYDKRECSDVTFIVGDKEIKAHRAILIARSTVFAAMFKHEMVENKENRVNITDISPDVFNESLRFIYTNQVCNIDEIADHLLQAADKYELTILKLMCENSLLHTLNVKTAAQTLVLADTHNCPQLMGHTINFINKHGLEVLNTLGFKTMEKSYGHLITAMYKALLIDRSLEMEKKKSDAAVSAKKEVKSDSSNYHNPPSIYIHRRVI